jgi:3-oxosteroid 1-dehydrogenase
MFSMNPPKMTSKSALESGFIIKSASLPELADKTGLSLKNLTETINRFNGFCKTGRDEDFHRGDFAYDRLYSDAAVKPNPCLGFIAKPPFYACKVYPGDLSTKGGLLADEHSRVLRSNGSIIKGLYATGNSSASVMGRTYPGPGATIGAAMTFAYVAGKHIAESSAS